MMSVSALMGLRRALLARNKSLMHQRRLPSAGGGVSMETSSDYIAPVTSPQMVINVVAKENVAKDSMLSPTINEVGGSSQAVEEVIASFMPQPFIPSENRVVFVEDSTLEEKGVAFGLATNITLPWDRAALEAKYQTNMVSFEILNIKLRLTYDFRLD